MFILMLARAISNLMSNQHVYKEKASLYNARNMKDVQF